MVRHRPRGFPESALVVGCGVTAALTLLLAWLRGAWPIVEVGFATIVLGAMYAWLRIGVAAPLADLRAYFDGVHARMPGWTLRRRAPRELRELARGMHRIRTELGAEIGTLRSANRQLERALCSQKAIFESLGEAILVVGERRVVVFANRAARHLFGVGDASELHAIELGPDLDSVVRDVASRGEAARAVEVVLQDRLVVATVARVAAGEADPWFAVLLVDLTSVHETSRRKDSFLSSVSHELRTPLTSIRSFTEILLHMTPQDEQHWREFLEIVSQESERLTRLVGDVLDLARLDIGEMEFHVERVSVAPMLQTTKRVFRPLLQARRAELEVRCAPDLPPVACDRDRLQQVLTNLVGNACKFVPDDGAIRLSAEQSGREVMIRVEDSGEGIPEEHRLDVFDKFQQVGGAEARKAGTGLGLAICKEIIERLDGRIWCTASAALGGAEFCFALPVYTDSATPTMPCRIETEFD